MLTTIRIYICKVKRKLRIFLGSRELAFFLKYVYVEKNSLAFEQRLLTLKVVQIFRFFSCSYGNSTTY